MQTRLAFPNNQEALLPNEMRNFYFRNKLKHSEHVHFSPRLTQSLRQVTDQRCLPLRAVPINLIFHLSLAVIDTDQYVSKSKSMRQPCLSTATQKACDEKDVRKPKFYERFCFKRNNLVKTAFKINSIVKGPFLRLKKIVQKVFKTKIVKGSVYL